MDVELQIAEVNPFYSSMCFLLFIHEWSMNDLFAFLELFQPNLQHHGALHAQVHNGVKRKVNYKSLCVEVMGVKG